MKFINYIKSFKEFIPTWIICIFMFFGIFGWTFVIGFALLIIQCFQKKKMNCKMKELSENEQKVTNNLLEEEKINTDNRIQELEEELKIKNIQLEYSEKLQNELRNNLLNSNNENNAQIVELEQKLKENELLLAEKQKEFKNKLFASEEHKKTMQEEILRLTTLMKENISQVSNEDKFVLCAGKYKAGEDIEPGKYNITAIFGDGYFESSRGDIFMSMSDKDSKRIKEYKNLELKSGTKITIEGNLKLKFVPSQPILFSSTNYLPDEMNSIQNELTILNNELILKYYIFSDYNNISSHECKNQLALLKQKESEMRTTQSDIIFDNFCGNKNKERLSRQLLRCFNSECDNIILNLSTKNIDSMRNKIIKSYNTINNLFSVDGVSISPKFLDLKLEQLTLLFTYHLKAQQEAEIQRAIKEQMIEEAKANREIEEANKKIDKDLQQYTGEVNRLMKYIEKLQIDTEKQIYMDKIKELEEKIDFLQSDKETILQRKTNSKAGFVYIISNIGSFGENIYKIGMTRRLEPMDRIKELSSASVPFEFDVHAMIFSDDAPALEAMLHKHFEKYAVNKINHRKEFFQLDIDEIEQVVLSEYNNTVQFTKIPLATEYRQSLVITQE